MVTRRAVGIAPPTGRVEVLRRPRPLETRRVISSRPLGDTVRLDTGEYVSRPEFETLTPALQAFLKKRGIEAFNIEQGEIFETSKKAYEEAVAYFEREQAQQEAYTRETTIEVGPERELVLRTVYDRLTPEQQESLVRLGIEGFREEQERLLGLEQAELEIYIKDGKLDLISAVGGGLINETDYIGWNVTQSDITEAQRAGEVQVRLDDFIKDGDLDLVGAVITGNTEVRDYFGWDITQENIDDAIEFVATNTQLDTGEWIPSEGYIDEGGNEISGYNDFSPEDQTLLMEVGVEAFQRVQEARQEEIKQEVIVSNITLEDYIDGGELDLVSAVDAGHTSVGDYPGWDVSQASIDEALELINTNTQLPDGEWIENTILDELKVSNLTAYNILITEGLVALDIAYTEAQDAVSAFEVTPDTDAIQARIAAGMHPLVATQPDYDLSSAIASVDDVHLNLLFGVATIAALREAPPVGLDYAELEKRFLEESGFYQGQVIFAKTLLWVKAYADFSESEKRGILDVYVQLRGTIRGWIAGYEFPISPLIEYPLVLLQPWAEYWVGPNVAEPWTTKQIAEDIVSGFRLGELVFPAMKALRPGYTKEDVTFLEWILTGVNVALFALPLWMPPVVRGVKRVFPRLRVGTYPYSEPALSRIELARPRIVGTRTITSVEVGMSEAQFARFVKFRVLNPRTTPFHFKAMEAFKWEELMGQVARGARVRPVELPAGITAVQRVEQARILAEVARQARLKAAYPAVKAKWAKQLAEVVARQKPTSAQIVEQALKNEAMWRAMAEASIRRMPPYGFYIPDAPFVIPLAVTSLDLNTQQLAGVQTLTAAQTRIIAEAAGLTEMQVEALAKAGILSSTLAKIKVLVKILAKTQGLTKSQTLTLIQALNKTEIMTLEEIETLTKAQIDTLAKILTKSQVSTKLAVETAILAAQRVSAKVQTSTQPAIKSSIKLATRTGLKPVIERPVIEKPVIERPTVERPTPKRPTVKKPPGIKIPLPSGVGRDEAGRNIYEDGTVIWKMGAWWKIIPPPYDVLKPVSSRAAPSGVTILKGTPQQTLTFIGGVIPFSNISFDLGVVDGFIDVGSRTIHFTGEGMKTDVGKRVLGPAKGLSIPAEGLPEELEFDGERRERLKKPIKPKYQPAVRAPELDPPSLKGVRP